MRQRLTSTDLSLAELMSGRYHFNIPAYQRDYTWGKDEAQQLIDDVSAVLEDVERDGASTPYFLGTMLFVEEAGGTAGAATRVVEVVDGQQRLITLTILFSVLRDLFEGEEADAIDALVGRSDEAGGTTYHLRLRAADEAFFAAGIQRRGGTRRGQPASETATSFARRNIEDVRKAVRGALQREMGVEGRRKLIQFLRQSARVLVVSSDDFDYAYQIFLTINDRGKRLSVEDIFRGEILGPLDREQRERYEAIIDEMDKYRGEHENAPTKGKTFFSHLATIDGWPRLGIIEGLKKAVETKGGPRRFAAEVFAPMAESYLQIKGAPEPRPVPPEGDLWLTGLRWLESHGDDDWVPIAMVGMDRLRDDPAAAVDVLRHLDRYAHGLLAMGCGREARRRHYDPILKRLLDGSPMPPAKELLNIPLGNQRTILKNIATRLHVIDPPTAKLVLARADQAISGRGVDTYRRLLLRDRRDPERFTVEHVCPKGDLKSGDWLRVFPRKSIRLRASQCIGNLVLVTEAQNKRSGQKDYAEKRRIYLPDDATQPFALTEALKPEADWDGAAIARRYEVIMAALKSLWQLEGPIPPCPALAAVAPVVVDAAATVGGPEVGVTGQGEAVPEVVATADAGPSKEKCRA